MPALALRTATSNWHGAQSGCQAGRGRTVTTQRQGRNCATNFNCHPGEPNFNCQPGGRLVSLLERPVPSSLGSWSQTPRPAQSSASLSGTRAQAAWCQALPAVAAGRAQQLETRRMPRKARPPAPAAAAAPAVAAVEPGAGGTGASDVNSVAIGAPDSSTSRAAVAHAQLDWQPLPRVCVARQLPHASPGCSALTEAHLLASCSMPCTFTHTPACFAGQRGGPKLLALPA